MENNSQHQVLPLKKIFVHHVFFYLKEKNNQEAKANLISGLLTLEQIPTIKFYNIGIPTASDRAVVVKDYDLAWLVFFESAEAEAIYQVHDIHKKFVNDFQHLWEKVVVYDTLSVQN